MIEENSCVGPRNPAVTNDRTFVEHPKTAAARRRASQPLPLEVVLMSPAEVARALGVSTITVFRYSKAGLLQPLKLGDGQARAPRRYRALDVMKFIESRLSVGTAT